MLPTNPLLNAIATAGPHLPVALLRQYAAGTLAPAAQHRVEAHTLACPRCADLLTGLQQTPPATTDQALAHLQQRLRQRVQQQAAPARHDREAQRNRWLLPQLAAAAALLLGLVAGGWWAWQQRQHRPTAAAVAAAPTDLAKLAGQQAVGHAMRLASRLAAPRPVPVGGYAALHERLRRAATEFKPKAPALPLSGTVQLRLTIGAGGNILKIKVLRGLRADYDTEAQRLVCNGLGWVPGVSSGQRAPLDVDLAVPF